LLTATGAPRFVELSKNCTDPAAVAGATVAVSVTFAPSVEGFGELVSDVVVGVGGSAEAPGTGRPTDTIASASPTSSSTRRRITVLLPHTTTLRSSDADPAHPARRPVERVGMTEAKSTA